MPTPDSPPADPDFRVLFNSAPGLYLVLTPDLVIVAASDAYLRATLTKREEILGRGIFEVFPANPDDPHATGVRNLSASLERVLEQRVADAMAVQKYDIRRPESEGGAFEERYWSPVNSPVLGANGEVAYIIHRVEDVTALVRLQQRGSEQERLSQDLRIRSQQMEAEIFQRSQAIHDVNRQLRVAQTELERRVEERTAELERATAALQQERDRFQITLASIGDAVLTTDTEGQVTFLNSVAQTLTGWKEGEAIGQPLDQVFRIIDEQTRQPAQNPAVRALREGTIVGLANHTLLIAKDGTEIPIDDNASPIRDERGQVGGVVLVFRNVTERRQAEKSTRFLASIVDSSDDAIISKDMNGVITSWNRAAERLFGYSAAEAVGRSIAIIAPLERADEMPAILARIKRGEHVKHFDTVRRAKDGRPVPVSLTVSPITDAEGHIVGASKIARDISERQRLTAERDALLSRLSLHIERMPLAYILFNADFRITDWNPAAQRMLGYTKEEALGMQPNDLNPPAFHEEASKIQTRILAGDMMAHSVNENLTKAGRTITCEWFNTPLLTEGGRFNGLLCLGADVTERKSLEAQLRQAQKMEAVGQLAGGVAHDFNNLITIISGYSDLMHSRMQLRDPMRAMVNAISEAGGRAATLTRQLLAFSRQTVLEVKVLDLNAAVRDTEKMIRRLIGEDISLTTVLDLEIGQVKIDPGQLDQVLMNLAVNARDAMPRGGKLTIETRNVDLDEKYADAHVDVRAGQYVVVAVSDTGCGMSPEIMHHIFEPFFTTKGVGKGTGLGLAMVYGFVKQSGGHIAVYSEPNRGTTFKIYFPVVEKQADTAKVHDESGDVRGSETVLLVEDDDGVRGLALAVLQSYGYTVLEARNGDEALRTVEKHGKAIDLLVTDVVLPGMDGREVAEALQPRFPQMKVLFTSGYTDDAVVRHGILQAEVAFIQKPYSPQGLAKKARQVLDRN